MGIKHKILYTILYILIIIGLILGVIVFYKKLACFFNEKYKQDSFNKLKESNKIVTSFPIVAEAYSISFPDENLSVYHKLVDIPVLYVSLYESERFLEAKQYLRNLPNVYLVPGIWGKHPVTKMVQSAYFDKHYGCSHGEIGCSLAHIKLAKVLYEKTNWGYCLCLEDDVDIDLLKTWKTPLSDIVKELYDKDKDWTTCQLFWFLMDNPRLPKITKRGFYDEHAWGNQAYLLSRKGAGFISKFKNLNADEILTKKAYNDISKKPVADNIIYNFEGARNYIYYPQLFTHKAGVVSDIRQTINN